MFTRFSLLLLIPPGGNFYESQDRPLISRLCLFSLNVAFSLERQNTTSAQQRPRKCKTTFTDEKNKPFNKIFFSTLFCACSRQLSCNCRKRARVGKRKQQRQERYFASYTCLLHFILAHVPVRGGGTGDRMCLGPHFSGGAWTSLSNFEFCLNKPTKVSYIVFQCL